MSEQSPEDNIAPADGNVKQTAKTEAESGTARYSSGEDEDLDRAVQMLDEGKSAGEIYKGVPNEHIG